MERLQQSSAVYCRDVDQFHELNMNAGELKIDIQLSDKMIGAKLYEVQNDQLRVIAYIT